MTNFIYDGWALPAQKTADVFPVTSPGTQFGKDDANKILTALADTRTAIKDTRINAKHYGAKGDGTTDDSFAINAAISAASGLLPGGAFGGNVFLPRGTYGVLANKIRLSNGVGLEGDAATGSWIVALPGFNNDALIDNLVQDGTQEYAYLRNLLIDGRQGTATCSTAVVNFVSLFIHSYVENCVILNGSNMGLRLAAAGTPGGAGPILVQNVWVDGCIGHNVMAEEVAGNSGAVAGFYFNNLTSEHQGSNSSALYLKGNGRSNGWLVNNFHCEMGNTTNSLGAVSGRRAITIDNVARVKINCAQLQGTISTIAAGIVITNTASNVGIAIENVSNTNLINPVISDLKSGVTWGAVNVDYHATSDIARVLRGKPDTLGRSFTVQDSGGTERAYFDSNGVLTGASVNGAGLDIKADVTNNRGWTVQTNAGGNVFEWVYPTGGGGVLRERYRTGNVDVRQIGTDGSQFFYQGLTVQGATTHQGNAVFQAPMLMTARASASFGTSQNNYNPTGFSTCNKLVLSATAGSLAITGFAGGADGRWLFIYNSGSNAFTLNNDDASSTAGNRIYTPGGTALSIPVQTGKWLHYDSTLAHWLVV